MRIASREGRIARKIKRRERIFQSFFSQLMEFQADHGFVPNRAAKRQMLFGYRQPGSPRQARP